MRSLRKPTGMSEIEGLIDAARQLGLPLPKLPAESQPVAGPPMQRSVPPRLGLPGSSPESGSPPKPCKRPSSSSGGTVSEAGEGKGRSRRRRVVSAAARQCTAPASQTGAQMAAEQVCALSESYQQLHEAHLAASHRISQLQGEVGHWHSRAQSLAAEAQQLRTCLALCQMQLASSQQHLHTAQTQPQAASSLLPTSMHGWGAAPLPSAVPSGSVPALLESFGAEQHLPMAGLPSCMGLAAPKGPLPTCDELDDILLPDFPL